MFRLARIASDRLFILHGFVVEGGRLLFGYADLTRGIRTLLEQFSDHFYEPSGCLHNSLALARLGKHAAVMVSLSNETELPP